MPDPDPTTDTGVSASDANEELKSVLYPETGSAAPAAAAKSDDFDPEHDDPADKGGSAEADDDLPEDLPAKDQTTDKAGEDADDADLEDKAGEDEPADKAGAEDAADLDDKAILAKARLSPEQHKVVEQVLTRKTAAERELSAKATKLEGQVTALSTEVDTLREGLPAPVATRENPLADVANESDLAARERKALDLRYWLMRNRDGGELPDGKGGKTTISPERRDELLAETDELVMVHLPARRDFIRQRRAFDGEARKAFPDLSDSKSELSLRVDAVLRHYPALQSMPEARLFIADALAHKTARTKGPSAAARAAAGAAAAGPGKGKDQSRRPPRTEGAPRVAARVNGNGKRAEEAHARFETTGRDDENVVLANLIGAGSRR